MAATPASILSRRSAVFLSALVFISFIYRQGSVLLSFSFTATKTIQNEIDSAQPHPLDLNLDMNQPRTKLSNVLQSLSIPEPATPRPDILVNKTRVFVLARSDRSGAAVLDYLKGLSFALEYGIQSIGVCGEWPVTNLHVEMVEALGLDQLIHFRSCPTNRNTDVIAKKEHNRGILGSFSSAPVLNYIRAVSHERRKRSASTVSTELVQPVQQVGVHIRRGDVNPCGYYLRYLPNSFYLNLIQQHAPKDSNVTIFSEPDSYESWDDFSNHNLALGGNVTDVWRHMLEMDVFILSRSSFSIVPAIVSQRIRKVVYLPYLRNDPKPLLEWTVVDPEVLNEGMKDTGLLRKNCTEEHRDVGRVGQQAKFTWPTG